jgi:hypothetical protein
LFKIYDGRDRFYQWDVDRKLIIEDATITQVHFCNRTDECSLVCETYQEDGLTLVNVPNILLQTDWRINVYAYDTNYTKFCETYKVERRSKPEDYVYTETEVLNFNTLLNRIDEVDANIAKSVNDYLEENPVEVDLTGYVTEENMAAAIAEIELTPGPQGPIGETGPAGKDGAPGKDGYTPVKGVDYFDGAPGKDGKDGKDGAEGKPGEPGMTGATGPQGEPGPAGKDGKDGVDGKDYVLTEADKREIAGMIEVPGGGGGSNDNIFWEGTLDAAETQKALSDEETAKLLEAGNTDVFITLKNHDDGSEITFNSYMAYDALSGEVEFQGVEEASNGLLIYLYLYTDNNLCDYGLANDSQVDIKIFLPATRDYYTKEEIDELLANLPSGGGDLPRAEGVSF